MRTSIIVPYRAGDAHRDAAWAYVREWIRPLEPTCEVVVVDSPRERFARGAALEAGAEQATGDVLAYHDADSLVPLDQVITAIELAARAPGLVIAYTTCYLLAPRPTSEILAGRAPQWDQVPDHEYMTEGVSTGGITAMTRETFERAGRHEPRFDGWGFEDAAFSAAVSTLVAPHRRIPGPLWHLWHPRRDLGVGNRELAYRYDKADGDPEQMRRLIAERAEEA